MPLDLDRMLHMCRRDQWSIDDLDWDIPARSFDQETETRIVQFFTDMAGIELLAAALFEVQREHAEDPVLREIFATFIEDERRHSRVARRLAEHYDVHRYRSYRPNPHLVAFRPHFLEVLRHVAPDIASLYIVTGELLLDIALLRSIDDFVDDGMSRQAMLKINRDESRHIAVDYHMLAYYGSEAYAEVERARPGRGATQWVRGAWATARFVWSSGPFLREVFFHPMLLTDPSGRRMLEAFKRIQLIGLDPGIAARPFTRFLMMMQGIFEIPVVGEVLAPAVARVLGLDPRVIATLYTEADAAHVRGMDLAQLADEALAIKDGRGELDLDGEVVQRRMGHKLWTTRVRGWLDRARPRRLRRRRIAEAVG